MVIAESTQELRPFEQRDIYAVHNAFHNIEGLHSSPPEIVQTMADMMCRSESIDHVIDSGWAYMQAGVETGRQDLINHAQEICKGVIEHTRGSVDEIKACLPLVIAPEYIKVIRGEAPDAATLAKRLHSLNGRVLSLRIDNLHRVTGIAPEVATLYLLNRHVAKNPEDYEGQIAWPAFPWQDKKLRSSSGNFDIRFGEDPDNGHKIQVKNSVTPKKLRDIYGANEGHDALNHWRTRYDPDLTLIFGDVHLGNTAKHFFAINSTIQDDERPKNKTILDIATQNILDEIDETSRTIIL